MMNQRTPREYRNIMADVYLRHAAKKNWTSLQETKLLRAVYLDYAMWIVDFLPGGILVMNVLWRSGDFMRASDLE
jgi:hypothetical protein